MVPVGSHLAQNQLTALHQVLFPRLSGNHGNPCNMKDHEAMRAADWHLAEDVDDFLTRSGDSLHSHPALHTVQLTAAETLRTRGADAYGAEPPVFGWLEQAGGVRATFVRTPPRRLNLTPLSTEDANSLAARLASLGHRLPGVSADHDTAAAFAAAWQRHTGATPTLLDRMRLYRLGALTPPEPFPEGRGRIAGEQDHEQVMTWCREFAAAGERQCPSISSAG